MDAALFHEDEGLWNELSHEQSREIQSYYAQAQSDVRQRPMDQQQHQHNQNGNGGDGDHQYSNFQQQRRYQQQQQQQRGGGEVVRSVVSRMLDQTTEEMRRFSSVFRTAAHEAWHEHQERLALGGGGVASSPFGRDTTHANGGRRAAAAATTTTAYLDEFGINSNLDDDPRESLLGSRHDLDLELQQQQQQQQQPNGGNEGDKRNSNESNRNNEDFVFLPRFHRRRQRDEWGAVADLDSFFSSLYTFYYHRGLTPIVCKGIVQLVTIFFTLFLSIFLFVYVDWVKLSKCHDESTCETNFFQAYVHSSPFSSSSSNNNDHDNHNSYVSLFVVWECNIFLYCILFTLYSCFSVWSFLQTLRQALVAKWVFEERLGISDRKLQGGAIDWDRHVVTKLMDLQQSGEYRIAINTNNATTTNNNNNNSNGNRQTQQQQQQRVNVHNLQPRANTDTNNNTRDSTVEPAASPPSVPVPLPSSNSAAATNVSSSSPKPAFDALVVAQRILRKENFMIALFNKGLIDLSVPFVGGGGTTFFCSSIEWSLYFCILNFMFNHKYQVRPAFYLDPSALRRRFVVCGIAHIIFMPFLLLFLTLYFGLQNAYDWKSTKRYLGPREWSSPSKWVFREFNELQHHFERRLAPSYDAAENYLKCFGPNELFIALGRILVFIGGSLGAVLFAFAAINDAILLHVKIADWNLLWFVGVVGGIYSVGKGMLPSEDDEKGGGGGAGGGFRKMPRNVRNMFAETDAALSNVAKYTHYYPDHWKRRGSDDATKKAFSAMFQYKAQLFVMEVASLILAPYILCVSMAKCAEPICEFVVAIKDEVPGAGEVCGFATFDFDKYSDETWEGRTLGQDSASLDFNRQSGGSMSATVGGTLTQSILRTRSVVEATRLFQTPRARHGKMEKSFFSFKSTHPNWKCSPSGQHLVDRVEEYKRVETAALSREQELHIQAAARQLETLALLEREREQKQQQRQQQGMVPVNIDETYINNRASAHADAGAGMMSSPSLSFHLYPQGISSPSVRVQPPLPPSPPPMMAADVSPSAVLQRRQRQQQQQEPSASNVGNTMTNSHQSQEEETDESPPFVLSTTPSRSSLQTSIFNTATAAATTTNTQGTTLSIPSSMIIPTSVGNRPSNSSMLTATVGNRSSLAAGGGTINTGLSTELRNFLNMSTFDPDISTAVPPGSSLGTNSHYRNFYDHQQSVATAPEDHEDNDDDEHRSERQYLWLERYHAHVAAAAQGQEEGQVHESAASAPQNSSPQQQQQQQQTIRRNNRGNGPRLGRSMV